MGKKPPPNDRRCELCIDWDEIHDSSLDERSGYCLLNPPTPVFDDLEGCVVMVTPWTGADERCRHFAPKQ